MKLYFLTLLLLSVSMEQIASQDVEVSEYGSSTVHKILSSETNKEYKITITTPKDYDKESKYKVLSYLDSWWLKETICGTNAIAFLSNKIEPIILVGISGLGNEMQWHLHRNYDYTPSPYDEKLMGFSMKGGSSEMDSLNTGGASEFIDFFEFKVMKYIEDNYPNVGDRGFIGHSYGGLFGVYMVQNRPEIFRNVILISPSVWWNQSEILLSQLFEKIESQQINTKIYLTVGGKEAKLLTRSITKLDAIFSSLAQNNFKYKYEIFENANHNSVIPQSVYNGLELMYGFIDFESK